MVNDHIWDSAEIIIHADRAEELKEVLEDKLLMDGGCSIEPIPESEGLSRVLLDFNGCMPFLDDVDEVYAEFACEGSFYHVFDDSERNCISCLYGPKGPIFLENDYADVFAQHDKDFERILGGGRNDVAEAVDSQAAFDRHLGEINRAAASTIYQPSSLPTRGGEAR